MVKVYGMKDYQAAKDKGMLTDIDFIGWYHGITPLDEFMKMENFIEIYPLDKGSLVKFTDCVISPDEEHPGKFRRSVPKVSYQFVENLHVVQDEETKKTYLVNGELKGNELFTPMRELEKQIIPDEDTDDDESEIEDEIETTESEPEVEEPETQDEPDDVQEPEDEPEEETSENDSESEEFAKKLRDSINTDINNYFEKKEEQQPAQVEAKKVAVHMEQPKKVAPTPEQNRKLNKKERRRLEKEQRKNRDMKRRFDDGEPVRHKEEVKQSPRRANNDDAVSFAPTLMSTNPAMAAIFEKISEK